MTNESGQNWQLKAWRELAQVEPDVFLEQDTYRIWWQPQKPSKRTLPCQTLILLGPAALALLSASGDPSPAHPQDTPAAPAGLRSSTPATGSGSAAPGNDSDSEWRFLLCLLLSSLSFECEVILGESCNLAYSWLIQPMHPIVFSTLAGIRFNRHPVSQPLAWPSLPAGPI